MTTIICPKCGTENPADAMNCKNCRINLKFALEHLGEMESTEPRTVQGAQEKPLSRKQVRKKRGLTYLGIAVACFVVNYLLSMYTGGAEGGAIGALLCGAIGAFLALATLICFVGGVIYLIGGFVGKE